MFDLLYISRMASKCLHKTERSGNLLHENHGFKPLMLLIHPSVDKCTYKYTDISISVSILNKTVL
jgi:hypothetical protein